MDNNKKTIIPPHKKTMLQYVVPESLKVLLILIIGSFALVWSYHPIAKDTMNLIIINNSIIVLVFTGSRLVSWIRIKNNPETKRVPTK